MHLSVLKTAMDGFWVADAQGCLLEVNDAYCRMSGYSETELLTMCIADLDAREKGSYVSEHIKKVLEQGDERFETRHRRKDGSVIDVEVSIQYRASDDGRLIAILRNITDRKRSEELLRLFKESVENSSDAIGMSTAEGKHYYQNEAFNNLFGEIGENPLATLYVDEIVGKEVRLACHNGQAIIDIEDSAPGVPDRELDRPFERLYRVEPSRNRTAGGAGLGLAICRNIVEAHAGTITAHSSPLGGVWISITLPLTGKC